MAKLNQVLAIEKGVKSDTESKLSKLYQGLEKTVLFNGFVRTYEKKDAEGEDFPSEKQNVQLNAESVVKNAAKVLTDLFDVTMRKDVANRGAIADVEVDGVTIAKDVPVTTLLFLEKKLTDVKTFISKLPVLDGAEDWRRDEGTGLFKSEPTKTLRTKKVQKGIVLYQATPEHPAQTQLITSDEIVGSYNLVKLSGAMPAERKEELLERVEKLLKAVKVAREAGNSVSAPQVELGEKIFGFLLK